MTVAVELPSEREPTSRRFQSSSEKVDFVKVLGKLLLMIVITAVSVAVIMFVLYLLEFSCLLKFSGDARAVRPLLYRVRLYWGLLNLAHISAEYSGDVSIVPGDGNRVPTRFGDDASVSGVALPIDERTFGECFGFVSRHRARCCRREEPSGH